MNRKWINGGFATILGVFPAVCQQAPQENGTAPLYQVTVTERSVDAVNYQYRSGPTQIDFRGTVLLPKGKGDATVDSQRGHTEIDAKFENLIAPQRFGREYLTYVLWAISPDGAPHNLGEIVVNASDRGNLRVTTGIQTFGLIVTAEPYSTVRQPSDVVVLENQVRPDTIGRTQPIRAKYDLMPRGHYTYQVGDHPENGAGNAPKVSMNQYEAILEIYEAQNAITLAKAVNAEQYAPDTFAKAQERLAEAQRLQTAKANTSQIIQNARESAEAAEDARTIAERRKLDDQLSKARTEILQAEQAKTQAEAAAQQARAEADAARAELEAERASHQRTESEAGSIPQRGEEAASDRLSAPAAPPPPPPPQPPSPQPARTELRVQLLDRLNGILVTRDTPRGLIVTLSDGGFDGAALRPQATQSLARVAAILASQPGLRVAVEGYSDNVENAQSAGERAAVVRSALVASGLPANRVSSRGFGNARPIGPNDTEANRLGNRRVEIVVSGDAIGSLAYWDKPYSVAPQK